MKTDETNATARPWRVRQHPADENEFHVSAPTPEGHPYHGRTKEMQVMSDEDYPTRRADAELIVAAVNEREALLKLKSVVEEVNRFLVSSTDYDHALMVDNLTPRRKIEAALAAIGRPKEVA